MDGHECIPRSAPWDIHQLVQRERVHGRVYVDQEIFEDELRTIWYGNWVYVGHESEVPRPGDYTRKTIGFQELILNRDTDGRLHLMFNRCPHRGNLVCREASGTSSRFRCPYHGWTFGSDGRLLGVPYKDAYADRFHELQGRLGLPEVEHVGSYAGFIFASLETPPVSLEQHLAPVKFAFDQLVGLSPDGQIELTGGWLRHDLRANWKVVVESLLDHYHPKFVHQSMFRATGTTLDQMGADSVVDLGGGHTLLGFSHYFSVKGQPLAWAGGTRGLSGYAAAMEQRYGPDEATRRLIAGAQHVVVFPNLCFAQMNVIVFQPTGVGSTIQDTTPVLLKGAPDLNRRILRRCEAAMGPAGMILADDAEMGERVQIGLRSQSPEWVELSRGLERERWVDGVLRSDDETDETMNRGFWRHYATVMAGASA